jgi:hypothetical protein
MPHIYTDEGELIAFGQNADQQLNENPQRSSMTAERAAEYHTTFDRFYQQWLIANNTTTETSAAIALKNEYKKLLINSTKDFLRQFKANPQVTPELYRLLKLPLPRSPRSRIPPVEVAPNVVIVSAIGRVVRVRVENPEEGVRRRPADATGAQIVRAAGALPTTVDGWTMCGVWTAGTYDVVFPDDVASGTPVFVSATYLNARGEYSPLAEAAQTNLPGGQVRRVAASEKFDLVKYDLLNCRILWRGVSGNSTRHTSPRHTSPRFSCAQVQGSKMILPRRPGDITACQAAAVSGSGKLLPMIGRRSPLRRPMRRASMARRTPASPASK